MRNRNRIDVSYDATADVLYLRTEKRVRTHNIEETAGLVLRYDPQTKEPVGATIIDYKEYWLSRRGNLRTRLANFFAVSEQEADRLLTRAE